MNMPTFGVLLSVGICVFGYAMVLICVFSRNSSIKDMADK